MKRCESVATLSTLCCAVVMLVTTSGCTTLIEGSKIDYKSASKLPPLEIPPDLTAPASDDRYTVPEAKTPASTTFSTYSRDRATQPQPGASGLLPSSDKARIERAGTQRWLVVKATPDQVWPVLTEFWQQSGLNLAVTARDTGVMETEWAENRAKLPQDGIRKLIGKALDNVYDTGERDKFRTRIEPGAEPGTTEVYISHRGMVEVYESSAKDRTVWQPRPADADLEAEMLRRLMVKFGVAETKAQSQLAEASQVHAHLVKGADGASQLTVDDSFDRAWRRVGLALDRMGFTVEDRDRSKGLYFVRYMDPQAQAGKSDQGLLSKFAFWKSAPKAADNHEQYRIRVTAADAVSQVAVENAAGAIDKSETATRILNLLLDQLK